MPSQSLTAALLDCHRVAAPTVPNFSAIAKEHNVVRTTLSRHYYKSLHDIPPDGRSNQAHLDEHEEAVLVKRVLELGKRRLYPTPAILRNMAYEICGTLPSSKWATRFIDRHKDKIKCMRVHGMEKSRHAAEYKPIFEEYFDIGFIIGQTNKESWILPLEETLKSDPAKARIDGSREFVTLIATICADGTALPPALIYKGVYGQVCESWTSEVLPSDEIFMGASEKGWTDDNLGLQWLTEVFDKSTTSKQLRRRLLIVDGHSSHVNYTFLQLCDSLRIAVCILPPHSTHRLQPLDVGVFSPLSSHYTTVSTQLSVAWEGRVGMSKSLFYLIFKQAWANALSESTIRNAFAKAGIHPQNRSVVMDGVFTRPVTPPPKEQTTPLHSLFNPPSSPLNASGSVKLMHRMRKGEVTPDYTSGKLYKAFRSLSADHRLMKSKLDNLEQAISHTKRKRTTRKYVADQTDGGVAFLGPRQFQEAREAFEREEAEAEEAQRLKVVAAEERAEKKREQEEATKVRRAEVAEARAEKKRKQEEEKEQKRQDRELRQAEKALQTLAAFEAKTSAGPSRYVSHFKALAMADSLRSSSGAVHQYGGCRDGIGAALACSGAFSVTVAQYDSSKMRI
ncbi:hypothetical protein TREMEDRAFT_58164 [Tremella mesenterica DSM 1558]|uniref:uncharacterized protein n=1 Tax=Tremella mesenterica (strain ATCC 24925 / CBS 8224 / DSM 1558 / NBRC 9311 / NRRL Y-6157 / RJB 2259-6 / UBC 559-6) TaxID=578456 RepID=UPI0003F48EBA|nr:uncharacterized protein TREMEDRAFT_58164 [Tremella mesenterica DSM 1558]EIW72019.1 hypothetical protein TREMEDRAFT_58164 [Tremella mesenterica DSM 1558]